MHGERCERVSAPHTPVCAPSHTQRGAGLQPPRPNRDGGPGGGEQLRRWGSLHPQEGVGSGADELEDLALGEINSSHPTPPPPPLLSPALESKHICHHTHSYSMNNTAGVIVLSAP